MNITSETAETNPPGAEARPSTRQLLLKIANCPCLYRHKSNDTYYAIKKLGRKQKTHSLNTSDRIIAQRRLKEWLANLDKIDSEAEKTTVTQLLDKFVAARQGKEPKTKKTEAGIIKAFRRDWSYDLDLRVSKVRPSMLDEWLAMQESRLENSSYNRYALFIKQLFEIAVADRMIADTANPYERIKKPWKKIEKKRRNFPTVQEFESLVTDIRNEPLNAHAEESADFIEFLGRAGVGQAEASALTWGDIDWIAKKINFRRKKTGQLFYVPFYPHLVPLLERLRDRFEGPPPREQKVFSIQDARKSLSNSAKRLGYAHFSQRNLRSFLIIYLGRQGMTPKQVAKFQGHSDGGKLILDTYSEAFSGADEAYEAERVASLPSKLS